MITNEMTKHDIIQHGGDVYRNRIELDFSVSINHRPLPDGVKEAASASLDRLDLYPDIRCEALSEAIAAFEGVRPEDVICGNGASELFMAAAHAFRPKKVAMTAPCYAGYGWAVQAAGGELLPYVLKEEEDFRLEAGFLSCLTEATDMVFLADPNNPTGQRIDAALLDMIREECRRKGILLVMDECFYPLTETGQEPREYPEDVLTVRAFTKVFGLPGLRLGYMIVKDEEQNRRIRRNLPEWNVSVTAQETGLAAAKALKEGRYLAETNMWIAMEKAYLAEELARLGIKVFPSDTNFFLLKTEEPLYDALLARGILVRSCANFEGLGPCFTRIAVRNHKDNERLIQELERIYERD